MKTVAILGGGPAGATAAERLARGGLKAIVLDEKLAWEKPCGGGLTYKAYSQYPYLMDGGKPKRLVHDTYLSAPEAGAVKLSLAHPIVIYSRKELNRLMLERAEAAGAQIEQTRVLTLDRKDAGWKITTRDGSFDADYCVVATGARNPLRSVGTQYTAQDTMYALGYYVPSQQEHIDIQFLDGLEGYIWVFPRVDHLSVGICGKGETAQNLRARLELYMDEHDISRKDATFYGHMLPALEQSGWRNNRLAGEGWMAVGDAGGLVDPITGEGLYYATRSGDIASQILLEGGDPVHHETQYRKRVHHDFGFDLLYGAQLAKRVFSEVAFFGAVPNRVINFMRRSPSFRDIMNDLFAGTQPYLELNQRLGKDLRGTLRELSMSLFFRKLVLGQPQA